MLTLTDLRNECVRLSAENGDVFDVPVKLNGRLTTTLGQCVTMWSAKHNCYRPVAIEISTRALAEVSDEDMLDVIRHEWSHYYLGKTRPDENHGHDHVFKELCQKIGCGGDAGMDVKYKDGKSEHRHHKYTLICPVCGEIGGYDRMCRTLRMVNCVEHTICGTKGLRYEQNW